MKLEDYLMERKEENQKRVELEKEVVMLQEELAREEKLHQVLHCALSGPVLSQPYLSSFPFQVQVLLMELGMVEAEIAWLERKVKKLKMSLYEERKETKELEMQQQGWRMRQQKAHSAHRAGSRRELKGDKQYLRSQNQEEFRVYKMRRGRRAYVGSASDILSISSARFNGKLLYM